MASSLILIKRGHTLVAEDRHVVDLLARIKEGQTVKAVVTVPRNLRHHRLLFAMLNTVLKAQTEPVVFPTTKMLLDALKIGTGHVREVRDLDGNIHFVPDSIDFASLDQVAFSEWFDHAVNVILERVIPHMPKATLEQEIYNMLGERGPDDMR